MLVEYAAVGRRHPFRKLQWRGGNSSVFSTAFGHTRAESGVLGLSFRVTEAVIKVCEKEVVQLEFLTLWVLLQGEVGELDRLRVTLLPL